MDKDRQEKRVLVTGGGRGIGEAIVEELAVAGYDVTFTYRSAVDEAEALTQRLQGLHRAQSFSNIKVDLADKAQVEKLAEQVADGPALYGFVHNAGATADALAALIDQARAEMLMQVNFLSMTQLIKAAMRPMMRARSGRIVGVGSITANRGAQGNAAYAATKGAMASYMKTLAIEIARKGVTANIITPGYVDTEMIAAFAEKRAEVEKQIPTGRYARTQEIASLVRYLLSSDAVSITGAEIAIDGGLSAVIGIRN